MGERWRPVEGYEDRYEVSDSGQVRGLVGYDPVTRSYYPRVVVLKQRKNIHGRYVVHLMAPGKRKCATVHRLVAKAFVPNPDGLPQVNHIDGNRENNAAENLEWCTNEQNMRHAWRNGLMAGAQAANDSRKKPIVRDDGVVYSCAYEAANSMGLSVCTVRDVLKGRMQTAGGHRFAYLTAGGRA